MKDSLEKKVFIKTYGCQMNSHDSEFIRRGLVEKGFIISDNGDSADIVILNTCSVREHAEHKVFSDIGRIGKDKTVVLAGCMGSEIKLRPKSKNLRFDYCFSTDEIPSIPNILAKKELNFKETETAVIDSNKLENFENLKLIKEIGDESKTVKIMEGCNNYCSYCIVPFVRGEERSVQFDILHKTAKSYADNGISDITLLGQNVNSYLSPDDDKKDFAFLLQSISEIDGIKKLRFMSPHPKDFNDKVIKLIGENDKISKNVHLPVQSGSDRILAAMNRGYSIKDYIGLTEKIRNSYADATFSTDIIVGFPGETEEDFKMTLSLMNEVRFISIYAFKYSPRPFTKAFQLNDDVSVKVKKERLKTIFEKQKEIFTTI